MKSLLVQLAGLLLLVPALAQAQDKVDLNTITKVDVKGSTVEIVGSKKPNFTTFTMTDPPRLVIDISEAVFSGVPDESQVGNGVVTAIKTASYGSDASAIARVLIGFTKDVETDIQSQGNKLVVKVAGGGGAPEPVAEKVAPAAATPPADNGSAREAARRAEEERLAQQKAAKEAEERARAEAEATRKQQEQEAREAAKRADDERKATQEAAARSEADRKAQEKADKDAAAKAERERKEEGARAAAEEKQRKVEEARAEREARAAEREPPKVRSAEPPKQDRVAMADRSPAPSSSASSSGSLSVSARRKTMTLVGFKQGTGTSQVFVRTNEPVRYTVSRSGDKAVLVELENTQIALSNNERFLDTSYFDTAVAMVTPQEGPTKTVRIEIKLKESVPYEAHQNGNEVQIDFQRPAKR